MEIEREKLQKLVDHFYEVCGVCEELDVYEDDMLDEILQKSQKFVDENFGRKLSKVK